MSPAADSYLRTAIAEFRKGHINRDKVDWARVSAEAFAKIPGAQTPADTYPAINFIIAQLGEKHTFLIPADKERAIESGSSDAVGASAIELPEGISTAAGPTIVRIPPFLGSEAEGTAFANSARRILRNAEKAGACGFVIDLRHNSGGNMWPMLNGLAALFRDGPIGSFQIGSAKPVMWISQAGRIAEGESGADSSFGEPMPLRNPSLPVAVLVGRSTKSSGEFTAMAFRGRPKTRLFGQPTGGYVTANDVVKLPDGAAIAMTVGWGSDRTGRRYADQIDPDVTTQAGGPTLDAALAWLRKLGCGRVSRRSSR